MNNETVQFISTLSPSQAIIATKLIEDKSKSSLVAYILMLLPAMFFVSGCHKFYLGKAGMGIAYLCTLGFVGLGNLSDVFTIPMEVKAYNNQVEKDVMTEFGFSGEK